MTFAILLIVLLGGPWLVIATVERLRGTVLNDKSIKGRCGLALLFAVAGVAHFVQTEPMVEMLPSWVPMRTMIIYVTGFMELGLTVGLLLPSTKRMAGISAMAFLLLVLPSNVYAAVNYTGMGGHTEGPSYLLTRIPLQILLIGWAWWFAVRAEIPPTTSADHTAHST